MGFGLEFDLEEAAICVFGLIMVGCIVYDVRQASPVPSTVVGPTAPQPTQPNPETAAKNQAAPPQPAPGAPRHTAQGAGPTFWTVTATAFIGFVLAVALTSAVTAAQGSFDTHGITVRTGVTLSIVVVLSVYTFLLGQLNIALVQYGEVLWLANFCIYVIESVVLAFLGGAVASTHSPNVGFGVYLLIFYATDLAWSIFTSLTQKHVGQYLGRHDVQAILGVGICLCVVTALAQAGVWSQYSKRGIIGLGVAVAIQVAIVTVAVGQWIRKERKDLAPTPPTTLAS